MGTSDGGLAAAGAAGEAMLVPSFGAGPGSADVDQAVTASPGEAVPAARVVDEVDLARAQQYRLLALLLGRAPTRDVLDRVAGIRGDASPLGLALMALADAAGRADPDRLQREFFDLFIGLGRGEFLPFASYYLTGSLHERPLAAVRADLARFGIERAGGLHEPEDHIAILCEVMAGLAGGIFEAGPQDERRFFERHLKPWAPRFLADLEVAGTATFYRSVATVGRLFLDIEAEAFAMDA